MNGHVVVVDDVPTSFAEMLASRFRARERENFSIAFSGGSTAASCYRSAASLPEGRIDWSRVDAFWGDERCVPLSDPDSNHRLVHESLLDRVGPLASDHPMWDGGVEPERAASEYDSLLAAQPPIDVVHLGLGPDGHTASLFPGSAALDSPAQRLVVSNIDPRGNNPHPRITLTFTGIARARLAIVTVEGEAKREAFARVRAGDVTAPAARIDAPTLVWLVDRDALGPDAGA